MKTKIPILVNIKYLISSLSLLYLFNRFLFKKILSIILNKFRIRLNII